MSSSTSAIVALLNVRLVQEQRVNNRRRMAGSLNGMAKLQGFLPEEGRFIAILDRYLANKVDATEDRGLNKVEHLVGANGRSPLQAMAESESGVGT